MKIRLVQWIILFSALFFLVFEAKTADYYKVLGVDKNASQREIQKAFHKLSLQYHPDKNKSKDAQQKFAEINNAYEILSDEEKRKNYDMYGDEKGSPSFEAGYPGGPGGYFTNGGPGRSQSGYRQGAWQGMGGQGAWQGMGGQGASQSFSFSFGGPSGSNLFGFGMDDILSNIFGGNFKGNSPFGSFGGSSSGSQSASRSSSKSIRVVNSKVFKNEIVEKGMTWLLASYTPALKETSYIESIMDEVSNSLKGALKVGKIDCEKEPSLCSDVNIYPHKAPRVFVYSYGRKDRESLVEYNGDLVAKNLKSFCQEHLPRFSKRVNLNKFEFPSSTIGKLPAVMLLSNKRDTPIIWRVLSGLYHKRFVFYDAEVNDASYPVVKKLGVDAFPAIVGWLSNGEKHILEKGINVKDLKSAVHDLSILLDGFEKKYKKTAQKETTKAQSDLVDSHIPLLTKSNFDTLCGDATPVCFIGAFRSSKEKEKLDFILSMVSQKSLSRRSNLESGSKDAISYTLLDATKQSSFLSAFNKQGFNDSDKKLLAYKPRRGKFALFSGEITAEEAERFISSVLNGDIQFTKVRQNPTLK